MYSLKPTGRNEADNPGLNSTAALIVASFVLKKMTQLSVNAKE